MGRASRILVAAVAAAIFTAGAVGAADAASTKAQTRSVSVKQYVHSFCVDFVQWRDQLKQLTTAYEADAKASTSIAEVATKTESFFDDASSATSDLAQQIKGLGTPKTANGQKVATALATGITSISVAFRSASSQVAALPTTDPTAFSNSLQSIASQSSKRIGSAGKAINKIGKKYDATAFSKAAKSDPSCKGLSSS